jgi:hypothetical protein
MCSVSRSRHVKRITINCHNCDLGEGADDDDMSSSAPKSSGLGGGIITMNSSGENVKRSEKEI